MFPYNLLHLVLRDQTMSWSATISDVAVGDGRDVMSLPHSCHDWMTCFFAVPKFGKINLDVID